jgi:uncharacterized lipoprotein YmbA
MRKILFAAIILTQAGCLSVPDSPSPRLYMPHSLDKAQAVQKFDFPAGVIIGVGPVKIPEYLNRPQMITRQKDNLVSLAQFDRWAEPLDLAMLRLLTENLAIFLPEASIVKFNWNIYTPVKYQLTVDVIEMEANLDKDFLLLVRWSVFDLETKGIIMTKRAEIIQPVEPHNYFGFCEALSLSYITLSRQIVEELFKIAGKNYKEAICQ